MLLSGAFVKFDVLTNQNCNRDNSKVITFFAFRHDCSLRLALSFLSGPLLVSE